MRRFGRKRSLENLLAPGLIGQTGESEKSKSKAALLEHLASRAQSLVQVPLMMVQHD